MIISSDIYNLDTNNNFDVWGCKQMKLSMDSWQFKKFKKFEVNTKKIWISNQMDIKILGYYGLDIVVSYPLLEEECNWSDDHQFMPRM